MKMNIKTAKFIRNCPSCNKEIKYIKKRSFILACKNYTLCMSCVKLKNKLPIILTRHCPQCQKIIHHTRESNRKVAEKKNSLCYKCSYLNKNYSGNNNPFYGKKHSEESKKKMSNFNSKIRILSDDLIQLAKINLAKVRNKRPLYNIWLEKFGKNIADQKVLECKNKQSTSNSGINNPMYGKPSPQGSGNGWSGWYKNWFFRSIRELSYMIKILEGQQLIWKIPDKNFKIPYTDYAGNIRMYFPDFIVENKIIEIKPCKLHNSPKILAKKKAAEEFCNSRNMTYELIDPLLLSEEEIKDLYINKNIIFLKKYDDKFRERYL